MKTQRNSQVWICYRRVDSCTHPKVRGIPGSSRTLDAMQRRLFSSVRGKMVCVTVNGRGVPLPERHAIITSNPLDWNEAFGQSELVELMLAHMTRDQHFGDLGKCLPISFSSFQICRRGHLTCITLTSFSESSIQ